MKPGDTRRVRGVIFGPFGFLDPQVKSLRLRFRFFPGLLRVLGIALLFGALSRPVALARLPQKTEGIDILLCIDTSSSMSARDMEMGTALNPSRTRLQVAKDSATKFLQKRDGDRIGLLQFARFADLLCPRTQHYDALLGLLSDVQTVPPDSEEDLTGIGAAVAKAAQVLSTSKAKSKIVVLLTDGEENLATPDAPDEITLAEASMLCKQLGVRVYVISSRPTPALGSTQDPSIQMARLTGGRYFSASDAHAVTEVYEWIDSLEKSELEEPRFQEVERFLPLLLLGLAVLLLARLLAETKLEVLP